MLSSLAACCHAASTREVRCTWLLMRQRALSLKALMVMMASRMQSSRFVAGKLSYGAKSL